jgi:hypothetical protein
MICRRRGSQEGSVSPRNTSNKTEQSVDVSKSGIMYIVKNSVQNSENFRQRYNEV